MDSPDSTSSTTAPSCPDGYPMSPPFLRRQRPDGPRGTACPPRGGPRRAGRRQPGRPRQHPRGRVRMASVDHGAAGLRRGRASRAGTPCRPDRGRAENRNLGRARARTGCTGQQRPSSLTAESERADLPGLPARPSRGASRYTQLKQRSSPPVRNRPANLSSQSSSNYSTRLHAAAAIRRRPWLGGVFCPCRAKPHPHFGGPEIVGRPASIISATRAIVSRSHMCAASCMWTGCHHKACWIGTAS